MKLYKNIPVNCYKKILWGILITLNGIITPTILPQNSAKAQTAPTPAPTYEVGSITVTGTQFLDNNAIIAISGLEVGDKVKNEDISKAIKTLWNQGLFADIKIYTTQIVNEVIFLEIAIKERARLSKYNFEGTRKQDEEELRGVVSLARGRVINDFLITNAHNAVLNFYKNKGFLNTTVEITQKPDPLFTNSNILNIKVDRGEKVKIENIFFEGNNNAIPRALKKQMDKTKERSRVNLNAPFILWHDLTHNNPLNIIGNFGYSEALNYIDDNVLRFKVFSSSKFISSDFTADKEKIIDYYNEKGYRDAQISGDTVYFEDKRRLNVAVSINEGIPYYFRNITFRGNTKYTDEFLSRILNIKKGDIYNKALLTARTSFDPSGNDISSLYMDDGYLFFNITPIEKAVVGDSIDVELNMYEGAQATIDKVTITGNDKTNEHVIRRELRTLPGNKFSRSDLIRSQREIAALGYFEPESIGIQPIPNPQKGTVDIEYKVTEKSSDQLELSAGWSGRTIVGSAGVSFNNFSLKNIPKTETWNPLPAGDGQRLSLRFSSTGRGNQSINASFTEPWLGGKRPNALSLSFYVSRFFNNYYVKNLPREDRQLLYITGATVGIGRRLRFPDDNFVLRNDIDYKRFYLSNWTNEFIINDGVANVLSLINTLSRYSLDQPIYPRSGSNFSLTFQFTPPFSAFNGNKNYKYATNVEKYKWAEFHKWKLKAEWFVPIVGNLVLRTAAKMGFMGYYNSTLGYSPFERFVVGGDGISNFNLYGRDIFALRGYTDSEVSGNTNIGSPFFSKYSVELRYPITLNPSSTIYVQAFVEGGNVWHEFKYFNPFELKRSAGLGLRIFLPMFGTLGFDYGVGFDKAIIGTTSNAWDFMSAKGRFSVVLGVEPE